jgi:hypothetical protein
MLPGGRKPIFFINNGRYNTLPIFLCGVTLKALASHFKKFHLNKFDWESKRNNFLSLNLFLSIFFLERYFFLIKDDLRKLLKVGHFVEKNILYHLRCFAPQTIKL